MAEPTQDPEVAQVLSAIRQLMEQGRTPPRPPPLLLTPELRIGGSDAELAAAPARSVRPAVASAPDPRIAGASVVERVPDASAGTVPDAPGTPPSPSAPKAHAAGGLLVLERPILPEPAPPGRSRADALPLLVLGAPEPDQGSRPPYGEGVPHEGPRPEPVLPEYPAVTLPPEMADPPLPTAHPVPEATQPPLASAAYSDTAASLVPSQEGATPPTESLPSDREPEPSSLPVSAEDDPRDGVAASPAPQVGAGQDAPPSGLEAAPDLRAGQSPADGSPGTPHPKGTETALEAAPPVAPDFPDLSAFMPLAGLPPSIALLGRGLPEPAAPPPAPPEAAQDAAPPQAAAAQDAAAPEVPDLSQAGSEEPAAWTEPDWPELRGETDPSDPAALPDGDLAGLLAHDDAPTGEIEDASTPSAAEGPSDPDGGLRERVVVIVREEIQRELGGLREVVRQEVRDALAERGRP